MVVGALHPFVAPHEAAHNASVAALSPLIMRGLGEARRNGHSPDALCHAGSGGVPGPVRSGTDIAMM